MPLLYKLEMEMYQMIINRFILVNFFVPLVLQNACNRTNQMREKIRPWGDLERKNRSCWWAGCPRRVVSVCLSLEVKFYKGQYCLAMGSPNWDHKNGLDEKL